MLFLRHLCLVLIGLRLLVPPAVCLCQLTGHAAQWMSGLLRPDVPPPPVEEHDDHADGCPASKMPVGMGVPPGPAPLVHPVGVAWLGAVAGLPPVDAASLVPFFASNLPLPDEPLCLILCALLI